ncbi:MAG: tetraacyldisaccharide 4'-kinase [Pseudolabrys sp.]
MREPAFWWREAGFSSLALSPLSAVYGAIAAGRMVQDGARAGVPVICVGNFTLGGSGKTPAAIAIARLLADAGQKPALLSRGYGGQNAGPIQVDPQLHHASEVGDEALLLAHAAPTFVSRDRVAGAKAAVAAGASVIVMDDGLQNPSLAKAIAISVVDGRRGIGNAQVFPAGPLRAPLSVQWEQTGALLLIGEGRAGAGLASKAAGLGLPVFRGRLEPDPAAVTALSGRNVLAFAGIGDPEKFFATLKAAGIRAPLLRAFADHHRYSDEEAAALLMQAEQQELDLLTTEKDFARIKGVPGLAALASRARVLPVSLAVAEPATLRDFLLAKTRR